MMSILNVVILAQYQYSYSDPLTGINTNNWYANQSVGGASVSSNGFTSTGDGTLVAKANVTPSTAPSYEVRMQLRLSQSGGDYMALLRASNDALLSGSLAG